MALAEYGNALNIDTDGSGNPILVDPQSGDVIAIYDRASGAWQVTEIEATTGDFDSVNTVNGTIGNRRIIGPNEDAQTIIESANAGDVFYLSPGATYKFVPPFDIPGEIAILNGVPTEQYTTGNAVTFQKDGDGQVNLTGQKIKIGEGILFDGRGGTYAGHGIVEELSGSIRNTLSCSVINMAGDGVRLDSFYDSTLGRLISSNNGGHGLVFTDVGQSHNSQITSEWIWIAANGGDGVRVNEDIYQNIHLTGTINNNGGPGFHATNIVRENNTITGNILENDGPAFLFEHFIDGLFINARTDANNQNPGVSAGNIGEIHFGAGGAGGAGFITVAGTLTESSASDAIVVNNSDKNANVVKLTRWTNFTEPAKNVGTARLNMTDLVGDATNANTTDVRGYGVDNGGETIERLSDGLTADFS